MLSWLSSVVSRFRQIRFGRGRRRYTRRPYAPWVDLNRLFARRLHLKSLEDRVAPAIFTVTNTNDSGAGSLRQAILDANATGGADDIAFAFAGSFVSIAPTSGLPTITEAVSIDAANQVGFAGSPLVELRGDGAGLANGFKIESSGSTIRGFVINRFSGSGILLNSSAATGNTVAGNWVGLTGTGTAAAANSNDGIQVANGASNNVIGGTGTYDRNVVSGNGAAGISLATGANFNTVAGNTIGLAANGATAVANADQGIFIGNGSNANVIGGTSLEAGNVISGNTTAGIYVRGVGPIANTVSRWFADGTTADAVGTSPGTLTNGATYATGLAGGQAFSLDGINDYVSTGKSVLATTGSFTVESFIKPATLGVEGMIVSEIGPENTEGQFVFRLAASGQLVLGRRTGSGSQIQGYLTNASVITAGVWSHVAATFNGTDFRIYVNGTEVAGTLTTGNYSSSGPSVETRIGSSDDPSDRFNGLIDNPGLYSRALTGGEISSINSYGGAWTQFNRIQQNKIGTDAAGTAARPNASGILIENGANQNTVGGPGYTFNTISGNTGSGVTVTGSGTAGNSISGNWIGIRAASVVLANGGDGVLISGGATGNFVGDVTADANFIGGNAGAGVRITGSGTNANVVLNNRIGLSFGGGLARPNATGVIVESGASSNTIGGTAAGSRNVISGNTSSAVVLTGTGTTSNLVLGNYLGTDFAGTDAIANAIGVRVSSNASGNTIGGTNVSARQALTISGASGPVVITYLGQSTSLLPLAPTATEVENALSALTTIGGVGGSVSVTKAGTTYTVTFGGSLAYTTVSSLLVTIGGNAGSVVILNQGSFGGNVISGNTDVGVQIETGATTNTVAGNWIGPKADNSGTMRAGLYGVRLSGGSGNTIGGTTRVAGNVITGSRFAGIQIDAGSDGHTVRFNAIGTDATESTVTNFGHGSFGVVVNGANNVIRDNVIAGAGVAEGTVGGGDFQFGVALRSATATGNTVAGNFIGTNRTGTTALGNLHGGVLISAGASNNKLGGTSAADRNIISGNAVGNPNGHGVIVSGTGTNNNSVYGNFIGTNPDGTAALGNGAAGVLIDGGAAGTFVGSSLTGAGNVISGNSSDGVRVVGATTTGSRIIANRIGTNAGGTAAVGNQGAGVYVLNAPGVQIGAGGETEGAGNVISGNGNSGIWVEGATATGTLILGNRVGTSADGLSALANTGDGLDIRTSNNTIGGGGENDRNVVSGNTYTGIHVQGGSSGNVIQGNYVGVSADGTTDIGNGEEGIEIAGSGNTVGGSDGGQGNVVSGNATGIRIVGSGSSGNTVSGNFIGTDASGSGPIANEHGVVIDNAGGNTIGGVNPGDRNVISGNNQTGVWILVASATANSVFGNYIGINATGTAKIGNSYGIVIQDGADTNAIGGTSAGAGNVISGNQNAGVLVTGVGTDGNFIRGNFIGTNAIGTVALANGLGGVIVGGGATNTQIGGTTPGAGNVVSGNAGAGVTLTGSGTTLNTVAGNYIGTNAAGTAALPNAEGVLVSGGATGNTIGGATAPAGPSAPVSGQLSLWLDADSGVTANGLGQVTGWADQSGNGFNGTTVGSGITLVDNALNGRDAVRFAGAGSLLLAGSPVLTSQQFTIVALVTDTNSVGGLREVFSNWSGSNSTTSVFLGTTAQSPVRARFTDVMSDHGGIGTITSPTQPFIFTGLSTATNAFLFQDETQIAEHGSALNARNLSTPYYVGSQGPRTDEYWTGDIVELLVYDRALSSLELAANWDYLQSRYQLAGATTSAANVISGNTGAGVHVTGTGTSDNAVEGNLIGTNAAGTAAIPNADGVLLDGNASDNRVGTDGDGADDAGERNVVSGNTGYGVLMDGSNDNVIAGNYVGTNAAGTAALPNYIGVTTFYSTGNVIGTNGSNDAFNANERNVISGNTNRGVILEGDNVLAGNYVGLNEAGTAAIGNELGVQVTEVGGRVGTNADGIADVEERNVISGNYLDGGISVGGATTQNVIIAGNYIGTNAAGNAAVPNSRGIRVSSGAHGVRIGMNPLAAAKTAEANVISGNTNQGILITDAATTAVTVAGNVIGLNAAGTAKVGNVYGIHVNAGAHDNSIGGSAFDFRNVISGNSSLGVLITSSGSNANVFRGNYIGTNPAGTASLGNGTWGVIVLNGAANVFGGDSTAGQGNLISGNGQGGIAVFGTGAAGNVIRGNTVGLNVGGTAPLANAYTGIYTGEGGGFTIAGYTTTGIATGTLIGGGGAGQGNVSSGNLNYGIWVNGTAASATIQGNRVGTNMLGTAAVGNTLPGVRISSGASKVLVGTDGDGTNDAAEGNHIAGNLSYGVEITGTGTKDNVVAGNLIGTNAAGSGAIGNQYGVVVSLGAQSNVIGTDGVGSSAGNLAERNVISGNNATGVWVEELNTRFNRIAGNVIGLNATQTGKLANSGFGILFRNGPSNNWVGTNGDGVGDADEGNVVAGNTNHGILLTGPNGNVLTGNVVAGNYVGTTATGTAGLGNSTAGVWLDQNAQNSWVGTNGDGVSDALERNVVSGNQGTGGINLTGVATSGNVVAGNLVGLAPNGTTALGNVGAGIRLALFSALGPSNTRIGTNADGTSDALERNVVGGNSTHGIVVNGAAITTTTISGNFVGTNAAGTATLANAGEGIYVLNANTTRIGTNGDGDRDDVERNVVSGNALNGIRIGGATATANVVAGNYVGTNFDATAKIANGQRGVQLDGGANNNRIGTDGSNDDNNANERNVLSGNTWEGLSMFNANTNNNAVAGNYIGTDNTGLVALTNGSGGIWLSGGPSNNRFGTDGNGQKDDTERNVISGNTGIGINISDAGTNGNIVAGNAIGLNAAGTAALGNTGTGVAVQNGAANNRIGVASGGGFDAFSANERNLIAGNGGHGVSIYGVGTNGTVVAGNWIGLDVTGTVRMMNGAHGVAVGSGADDTRIGTNGDGAGDADERNVISGSFYSNVLVEGQTTDRTVIAGNYIGPNAAATAAIANGWVGIELRYGAQSTRVGTDGSNDAFNANERNIISGNTGQGIFLSTAQYDSSVPTGGVSLDNTVVAGNWIGLAADGTKLTNTSHGIYATNRVTNLRIGTDGNGQFDDLERNVISGNTGSGIYVEGWTTTNLTIADQVISGAIPSTQSTGTVSQVDFSDATSAAAGNWTFNNPIPGGGGELYVVRATGTIQVTTAGTYSFALGSDNGGRLRIDGTDAVVDNTNHAFTLAYGSRTLTAGTHTFEVVGYEAFGGAGFEVSVALGSGVTTAVTDANGWRVLGAANPHAEIALSGTASTTAYYFVPASPLNITIAGNYIGTNVAGDTKVTNTAAGVTITNGASGVTVGTDGSKEVGNYNANERNVISGNTQQGVYILGTLTKSNVVAGNFLGLNAAGTAAIGNAGDTVAIGTGAYSNLVGTNADGYADAEERNVISGGGTFGIQLSAALAVGTRDNVVAGNYIGTNAAGTAAVPNASHGIQIRGGTTGNRVGTNADGTNDAAERNLISGNTGSGILITGAGAIAGTVTKNNVVAGNYVGTNFDGSAKIANAVNGIQIDSAATANTIGGTAAGAGNVISGNTVRGIFITTSGTNANLVQGNLIGLNAAGTAALANGNTGILIGSAASNNVIGGTVAGAKNVISGNTLAGIAVQSTGTTGNLVQGNWIGLNAAGTAAIANVSAGVALLDGSSANTIGGGAAGAGNVISGNTGLGGLVIGKYDTANGSNANVIQGNRIGTNPDGTAAVPNAGAGIRIQDASSANIIGAVFDGTNDETEHNVISGNTGPGVHISGANTNDNEIRTSLIGLNAAGTAALPNATGVRVESGALRTVLGSVRTTRPIISGNTGDGIVISGLGTDYTAIIGVFVGTNPAGSAAIANTGNGIRIENGPYRTAVGVRFNTSSSVTTWYDNSVVPNVWNGSQNLISGNAGHGISVTGATTGQTIFAGNYVGTDKTGTYAVGNGGDGVNSDAPTALTGLELNSVVASFPGVGLYGMLIAGNLGDGVEYSGAGVTASRVRGSVIGLAADGVTPLPNGGYGVNVNGGASNTVFGQPDLAATGSRGNVISGNSLGGVRLSGVSNTTFYGNKIGTTQSGTGLVGNGSGDGVRIENGSTNTQIGTNGTGTFNDLETNAIRGHAGVGIRVTGAGSNGTGYRQNRVDTNAGGNYVIQSGAQTGAVTPVFAGAIAGTSKTQIVGTLTGQPGVAYRVEMYRSTPGTNGTTTYVSEITVTPGFNGTAPIDVELPVGSTVNDGFTIYATRLDTNTSGVPAVAKRAALVLVSGAPAGGTVDEGTPITLTTRATDPGPGESVGYEWRVTKNGNDYDSGVEATFTFVPDDNGTYVVTLRTTTTTGLSDTIAPLTFTVGNRAPVLDFVNPAPTAAVGTFYSILAAVADPGTADTLTYQWLINGLPPTTLQGPNPKLLTFPVNAAGTYVVTLTVTDDDDSGGSGVSTLSYAVVASGGLPDARILIDGGGREGSVVTARADLGDILAQDNLTFTWTVSKNGAYYDGTSGVARPNFEFTPNDDGQYVIDLTVTTETGVATPAPSQNVFVTNLAPEGRIDFDAGGDLLPDAYPPTSFVAGTPIPYLGSAQDPGTNDVHTFEWAVEDVVSGLIVRRATGRAFPFNALAAGTYVVTLTVRDDDGGSASTSTPVVVEGGARDVTILGPGTVNEGALASFTSTIDPPAGGTSFRYFWDVYQDGQFLQGAASQSFSPTPVSFDFRPPDNGTYEIRLRVVGDDGSSGETAFAFGAVNVAPTVTVQPSSLPGPVAEGTPVVFTATPADPAGANDTISYQWLVGGVPVAGATEASFTFSPPDGGEFGTNYQVSVEVRDEDQPLLSPGGSASVTVTASNVAPVVTIATAADANGNPLPGTPLGMAYNLVASTVDPGGAYDPTLYEWSVLVYPSVGGTPVALNKSLTATDPTGRIFSFNRDTNLGGTYVVTAKADDGDGGVDIVTTQMYFGDDNNNTIVVANIPLVAAVDQINVIAGGGNDTVDATGVTIGVALDGGTGNDTITGGSGGDIIQGGDGTDSLAGGAGNDTLVSQHGNDTLDGGEGNDEFVFNPGSDGTLKDTGGGIDTINFELANQHLSADPNGNDGITFDLNLNDGTLRPVDAAGNRIAISGTFEVVKGSRWDDKITAASGTTIFGGGGDDELFALAGTSNVTLFGGEGNDELSVLGALNVTLFGGEGADRLEALAGSSNVTLFGGEGNDDLVITSASNVTVFGGEGLDEIALTNVANVTLFGGDGADAIDISGGHDILIAGSEGEIRPGSLVTLFGGVGDDDVITLRGGTNVTVFGGDGSDTIDISDNAQNVVLDGGAENDIVRVKGTARSVTLFGGDGTDNVSISEDASNVVVNGEGGIDLIEVKGLARQITLFGGDGTDTIDVSGDATQVVIDAGSENDLIYVKGSSRQVTLFGGEGTDTIDISGNANDILIDGGLETDHFFVKGVGTARNITLFGGDGIDTFTIENGANVTIFGGEGNDDVFVTGGTNVTVFGGEGNDHVAVTSTGTNITVFGGEGNDVLEAASSGAGNVTLFGGEGDDALTVSAGSAVTLFGGAGDDDVFVRNGTNVTVFGGEGRDEVFVTGGTDVTVFGGEGGDVIDISDGTNVVVDGEEGIDRIKVRTANVDRGITVFGGDGADEIEVVSGRGVTVFGGVGEDVLTVTGGVNVTVFGGEGNDVIVSDAPAGTAITLFGGEGNDRIDVIRGTDVTVFGGEGTDDIDVRATAGLSVTVFGGDGGDAIDVAGGSAVTVFGGDGIDLIAVSGGTAVTVFGGEGNDVLTMTGGSQVTLFGNEGNDTIVVNSTTGVTVFGGDGHDAMTVNATGSTTLFGGAGDDTVSLTGGAGVTVFGGDGADAVTVGATVAGDVTVFGGEGNDNVLVRGGTDVTIYGENGNDTLVTDASSGRRVTLFGGAGDDLVAVTAGSDVTVFGGSGNDDVTVSTAGTTVTVFGGTGDDELTATGGQNVRLLGDRGNDVLTSSNAGGMTLFGGAGDDSLLAGGGLDVELFGDDGDDYYKILARPGQTRVRVKEITTLGEDQEEIEKLFQEAEVGTSHLDRPATGAETLDLSDFFAVTIDLNVLGSDVNPLAGWQTVSTSTGGQATIVLHGYFENVIGTAGDDTVFGNAFNNVFEGGGGNDALFGFAGDDTFVGGEGDDVLDGGPGSDTYVFGGLTFGSDTVVEAPDEDADAVDFSTLVGLADFDLSADTKQSLPGGFVTLSDGSAIENATGSSFADKLYGNARPNRFTGGAGNDSLAGRDGDDTYVYEGEFLGTDTVQEESDKGTDTFDFGRFLGGVTLDLTSALDQPMGDGGTVIVLDLPAAFENVLGSSFGDRLIGNVANNVLIGGGGLDYLDGGTGANVLRGGSGQVLFLDFVTHTESWEWQYDASMREAVRARLAFLFRDFGYDVTTTPPATGPYLTIAMNDGPAGGATGEIDFRNLGLDGRATVNVTDLLPVIERALVAAGQPVPTTVAGWTPYVVNLTATIAAHEGGHALGLRHGDSYGAIGQGVNSAAQAARYLPALVPSATFPIATGAADTKSHVMSSPDSNGSSILDSAGPTYFGVREAIKLAFADTGTVRRESSAGYNAHGSFANAVPLGRFDGLSVPNTLAHNEGTFLTTSTLSVAATAVLGSIVRNGSSVSENDVYSFSAKLGERFHFEINSQNLSRLANSIDSVLKIYDHAGNLVAINDDEFETADSVLVDWLAPADGEYYVVVDTYTPDGVRDFDTGQYEMFAYRAGVGADLGRGDTIVATGDDEIVTSSGRDTIQVAADASARIEVKGNANPIVDTTRGGDFTAFAGGVDVTDDVPEISVNHVPTLDPVTLPGGLVEGQSVSYQLVASDADANDRLTFRIEALSGYTLPSNVTVGEVDGVLNWTPLDDNPNYGFRVIVTDIVGESAERIVIAAVANLNPTAAVVPDDAEIFEGESVTFTSTVNDPGPTDVLTRLWAVDGVNVAGAAGAAPTFTLHPTQNRNYVVTLTVTDGDAGSVVVSRTVTVVNRAPEASFGWTPTVPTEKSTIQFIGSATDAGGPGDLASYAWKITKGAATVKTDTGTSLYWTPADDGDYVVSFTVRDIDGLATTVTRPLQVFNLPPVVAALAPVTVAEGSSPFDYTAAFADNENDGPFTYLWRVTSPNAPVADGTGPTFSFNPTDSGTYSLLLKVTDKDGSSGEVLTTITVTEFAPSATFPTGVTVAEGGSATVTFTNPVDSASDLSAGLKYSYALSPADLIGTYAGSKNDTSASFTFTDDGTFTVYGRVIDQNGLWADRSAIVTVTGVAPTATLSNGGPVPEGSPVVVSFTNGFDPSATDLAAGLHYSFATSLAGLATTYLGASDQATASFTFPDNGPYTVFGRVFDKDGKSTPYSTTVTVTNVAPTASLGNAGPVYEGSPVVVSFTSESDVSGPDLAAKLRYSFATTVAGLATTYAGANTSNVLPFTFPNNGTYTVYGRVFDKDGGASQYQTTVTVLNQAPTATIAGPTLVVAGDANVFTLTAKDASSVDQAAAFTFKIDWDGNGTVDQTVVGVSGTKVSRTFPVGTGTVKVGVNATDIDGATGTTSSLFVSATSTGLVGNDLVVLGSPANNTIRVDRDGSKVRVKIDGRDYGAFTVPGKVLVYAGDGDDDVRVDSSCTRPTTVYGQGGNDTLRAGGGADVLDGGDGNDSLTADSGNDTLLGGAGNDTLKAGSGNDLLDGGDGNDSLTGDSGNDTMLGGAGNDTIKGGDGKDSVSGGAGDDSLSAGDGNDTLDGGDGNDTLTGSDGRDVLTGGAGDDTISGGDGDDFIDAGSGRNTVSAGDGNDSITAGTGDDSISGGDGHDTIAAGDGKNTISGGDGNDSITTGTGNDSISAGDGHDTVVAGDGADTVRGEDGNDSILGGAGDDDLSGGDGNDKIDGGTGYADSVSGGDGNDTLSDPDGVARMSGDDGADSMTATFVLGWNLAGSFVVPTGAIAGGDGNDTIKITSNRPTMTIDVSGNDGDDIVELHGTWTKAKVIGGSGYDRVKKYGTGLIELNGVELLTNN